MSKLWRAYGPEIPDVYILHPGPVTKVKKKFTKSWDNPTEYHVEEVTSLEQFINALDKDLLKKSENEFMLVYDGSF